nr:MAG TPA: hypothetical protein [Bacteriophage sp.]
MGRIPMRDGFSIIPEGEDIFRVYEATYDEDFGRIAIKLVNAAGATHIERFSILNNDGDYNEGALNAFSYFAKNVMDDLGLEDVDPVELVDHYVGATVEHTVLPSNKDPKKNVTFAHLKDLYPVDGFDPSKTVSDRARTLGSKESAPAPKSKTAPSQPAGGLDLDSLLR